MAHTPEQQREFISLITQYQPSLRAYIISLMPGLPGASDVLQETNLVLWDKREQFKVGTNFIAWSYTIARFQVKSHRRKILKNNQQFNTLDEDLAMDLAEFATVDVVENEKRIKALEDCVKSLRKQDQELLTHRYKQGGSLQDYADTIGRSTSALSVTLHRIRQKLRLCIDFKLNSPPA